MFSREGRKGKFVFINTAIPCVPYQFGGEGEEEREKEPS